MRLKKVLHEVIGEKQGAFLSNRAIADNILVSTNTFQEEKNLKRATYVSQIGPQRSI